MYACTRCVVPASLSRLCTIGLRRSLNSAQPSRPTRRTPIWRVWVKDVKNMLLTMIGLNEMNSARNFEVGELGRYYEKDGVLTQKWLLVYNDRNGSAFHRTVQVGIPIVIALITILVVDYRRTGGKMSFHTLERLVDDATEMSYFLVIPGIALTSGLVALLHIQRLYLFRMYLNRKDASSMRVLTSSGFFVRRWKEVKRTQLQPLCTLEEETVFSIRTILFGHLRVAGRAFLLSQDSFRSNQLRTYVLGETDKRPKTLSTLDLEEAANKDAERML